MPLIVPGVCRYAINGVVGNRTWSNVLDFDLDHDFGDPDQDRDNDVADFAKVLLEAFNDHILPSLSNDIQAVSVSWTDLNSASGSTGEVSVGIDGTIWPANGGGTAPALPGNTAILVRKAIVGGRGRKSGRMYICGLGESATADGIPNQIIPTTLTAWNTNLAAFLSRVNEHQTTPNYQPELVVVHVTARDANGNPTEGDFRSVTGLLADDTLATQRRRLR